MKNKIKERETLEAENKRLKRDLKTMCLIAIFSYVVIAYLLLLFIGFEPAIIFYKFVSEIFLKILTR